MGASRGLNKQQKIFCEEYLKDLNATRAYKRAGYSAKRDSAIRASSSQLLANPNVQSYIEQLVEERSKRTEIEADDVLRRLHRSAFSDIRDFVRWENKNVQVHDEDGNPVHDEHGHPVFTAYSEIHLLDMDDVDGQDIAKIKQGRHGIEIERVDPLKSRELLGKHLKLFTEKQEVDHAGQVEVVFNIPRPTDDE